MKNFLREYVKRLNFFNIKKIDIPLLPFEKSSIRFLSIIFHFKFLHNLFLSYLKICLNKKENARIVFLTEQFILKKPISLPLLDLHLQALRNLSFYSDCINLSRKTIDLFPNSDIGYWHIIHAFIHLEKLQEAAKIISLCKKNKIYSKRFNQLSFANSILKKYIKSISINKPFKKLNTFYSDSGLIGQTLLKSNIKKSDYGSNTFSIYISSHGGFSNTLTAILNAIGLAKLLQIKNIFILKTTLTAALLSEEYYIDGISLKISESPPLDNYIEGCFFSHFDFIQNNNSKFKSQRKYFANHILEKFIKKKTSPKNELVIHIRSGDIFDSKLIHPKYGQPPLSFYILAINHFKPKSIILIFEDKKNPTINSLVSHIKEIKCKLKIQKTSSLKDDISYLFNAKNIVCGNGTFVPGILLGSSNIESIYIFEAADDYKYRWSLEHIKKFFNVYDKNGFYRENLLSKNWCASNFQLWLMNSYSINHLRLECK